MTAEQCPDKDWCPKNCLDPFTMNDKCFSYLTLEERLWYWSFIGLIFPNPERNYPQPGEEDED
jgi:hypothetical protein